MVSIIVPVYNVKPYLNDCVNGVLKQSYQDWELFLIDDGSSDGSSEVCDQIAELDSRIVVVHKQNTGVSDTRNHGLDLARGDYVIFLDSDDFWCDFTFLEEFVDIANNDNLDIIRGEYKTVNEEGIDLPVCVHSERRLFCANKIVDSATFFNEVINGEFFGWLCLIKRNVIDRLRFDTQQVFLEDMKFYTTLFLKANRCMYIPAYFYAYRRREASVSSQANIAKLKDSFGMCDFFNTMALSTEDRDLQIYFRRYSIMMYYWTLDTVSMDAYYYNRKDIIRQLDLADLMRRVNNWSESYEGTVPAVIRIKPDIAVILLRIKHGIGRVFRTLLAKIK